MGLPGGSSGTTGGTASAARRTRGWRSGSTRSWSSARARSARARACAPRGCCSRINGRNLHELGQLHFDELQRFLSTVKTTGRGADAGRHVLNDIRSRLDLLLGIGLDYLSFNRRSSTLSGGESQRIRLSSQIGSGLMGMLYVLDEPSIGLHPKDNVKMIATIKRLRDIGNTVIVVEHDEDTIRAADHLVEMGPGPGVHGGRVVAQGTIEDLLECKASPTGQFLSGARSIAMPAKRRKGNGKSLVIRGARENNLKSLTVTIPLGQMVAVTGASGSGKSTLVTDILYKALWKRLVDTRTLPGDHDGVDGVEHVHKVVNIDQSPIGRNSRSNPATYIGFYDAIRDLFAATPLAVEREYKPGRFSFNVKGGRCEECQGEGVITTQLYFMPDVEVTCGACKGARFNSETLEVRCAGKTIDDILNMSVEEGVTFFAEGAVDRPQDSGARRPRPRLSHARPVGDDAVRRRGAADQDRDGALDAPAREAHGLHPRRADDGFALRGHRTSPRVAEQTCRRRPHGAAHRAPSRRHQDRGPRDRSRAGRRSCRRGSRRHRDAGGDYALQGVAYRAVPEGAYGRVAVHRGATELETELIERGALRVEHAGRIREIKMFGGIGFMLNGQHGGRCVEARPAGCG